MLRNAEPHRELLTQVTHAQSACHAAVAAPARAQLGTCHYRYQSVRIVHGMGRSFPSGQIFPTGKCAPELAPACYTYAGYAELAGCASPAWGGIVREGAGMETPMRRGVKASAYA